MKSITIHKIDDETEQKLLELANKEGISLNRLIKKVLRESLGLDKSSRNNKSDFADFLGVWSDSEAEAFQQNVAPLEEIHNEDWE